MPGRAARSGPFQGAVLAGIGVARQRHQRRRLVTHSALRSVMVDLTGGAVAAGPSVKPASYCCVDGAMLRRRSRLGQRLPPVPNVRCLHQRGWSRAPGLGG